jgi:hypothetical protein
MKNLYEIPKLFVHFPAFSVFATFLPRSLGQILALSLGVGRDFLAGK